MNINDINKNQRPTLSFEVFPPKREESIEGLFLTIKKLKAANPAFISVTYGAGGSKKDITVEIASRIKSEYGIEPLAHLTCVGSDKHDVSAILKDMKAHGIDNILALRGDVPKGMPSCDAFRYFKNATDLIDFIQSNRDFHITAAAYPEGHPQSPSKETDLSFLKLKQDKGAIRFNTQLCFHTDAILRFIEKARHTGITVPISIGLMPVLNPQQILRMVTLAGASIPSDLSKLYALYGSDENTFRKFGLDYAKQQVKILVENGVDGIHLYTMNRPEASIEILRDTGLI